MMTLHGGNYKYTRMVTITYTVLTAEYAGDNIIIIATEREELLMQLPTTTSLQSCLNLHSIQHHIVAPISLPPHAYNSLGFLPNAAITSRSYSKMSIYMFTDTAVHGRKYKTK